MRIWKAWPFLLSLSLAQEGGFPPKEELVSRLMVRTLKSWHFQPPEMDDELSRRTFDLYLKSFDPQKRFFRSEDLDSLRRWRNGLDEALLLGDFEFANRAATMLNKRVGEVRVLVASLLKTPPSLESPDSIVTEPDDLEYPRSSAEIRKRWVSLLRLQALTRLQAVQEDSLPPVETPPDSAALATAWGYVGRNIDRLFDRMLKEEAFDRAAGLLSAFANACDPHTEYFKPEAREDFNLSMSGTLEGIGAVLREDDGYIKVVSIVPGSASWRQKQLQAEDKILKVAQGKEEPVDIVNVSVNDAVRLIRGPKGTEVRLTVEKPSGEILIIPIVRDVVVVEETYAKAAVLQEGKGKPKVGYISLPSFYHDFQKADGRRSSDDVKKELLRLKERSVEAVILDLRGNGGGALEDAVNLAGLFFPEGPVVQVKNRDGSIRVLSDEDPATVFTGPLVVMVNSFSASASEIVGAALQDYGRAVILGTDSTFGKGTVQSVVDLDRFLPPQAAELQPLGAVKITVQKFYRINGHTTQFLGVIPDILVPDAYTRMEIGERSLPHALPEDRVPRLEYARARPDLPLEALRKKSAARQAKDPYFRALDTWLEEQEKKRERGIMRLDRSRYFEERRESRKRSESLEKLHSHKDLKAHALASLTATQDSLEIEKEKRWEEQLGKDAYLGEAYSIVGDLLAKRPQ